MNTKTAVIIKTQTHWAKGKTFPEALRALRRMSTIGLSTRINITNFICDGDKKDWFESISADMFTITANSGDKYFQESDSFTLGDFFGINALMGETINALHDCSDKKSENLAYKIEEFAEENFGGLNKDSGRYESVCDYIN